MAAYAALPPLETDVVRSDQTVLCDPVLCVKACDTFRAGGPATICVSAVIAVWWARLCSSPAHLGPALG